MIWLMHIYTYILSYTYIHIYHWGGLPRRFYVVSSWQLQATITAPSQLEGQVLYKGVKIISASQACTCLYRMCSFSVSASVYLKMEMGYLRTWESRTVEQKWSKQRKAVRHSDRACSTANPPCLYVHCGYPCSQWGYRFYRGTYCSV